MNDLLYICDQRRALKKEDKGNPKLFSSTKDVNYVIEIRDEVSEGELDRGPFSENREGNSTGWVGEAKGLSSTKTLSKTYRHKTSVIEDRNGHLLTENTAVYSTGGLSISKTYKLSADYKH